ncbi:MAG: TfoX/Sxy family protein [Gemmatimonadales bacterium]
MAFDETLASRVQDRLARRSAYEERSMFGGLALMVDGKMAIGISGTDLMVRVGPDAHDDALAQPGARPMDFTGRPMRGFVFVGPEGTRTARDLDRWIDRALAYNPIAPKSKARSRRR